MRLISVLLAAVAALSPISALTTPSSPPSLILMPAALSTKGRAAAAARNVKLASSPSSSAATYDSGRPMPEALLSIRRCYRTCFFASAVDVTITLIDNKIWSKLFSPKSLLRLRWTDYVDIFDSMSLLIFAFGLRRLSKIYERWMQGDEDRMNNESLSSLFSLMCWIWRVVALNFAFESLADASVLPQMSMKWLGLQHVSSTSLVTAVATTLVLGYSMINSFCARIATVEDERDDNRISSNQSESKTRPQYKSIRMLGYRAFCGQALCAASFGLNSCMKLSKWLVAADTGIVGRASSLKEWAEPFAMTALLIGLNKAFLRAAIVRSREESRETAEMDKEIFKDLFTAQIKFYTKVAEVIKGIAIFRLLPYLVAPLVPYASAALKQIAPVLFERVFGA
mmetsp:Transcript_21168/g.31875  ORF Transcript_21168/g.31875 Transcript_21168/m.31875 type:complete len:397 (+) Transcript_21168:66-1256(+)